MANAASYVSYQHAASGSEDFNFIFTVTFSGSYTQGSGQGETINLLTAANANGLELSGFLPANTTDTGYVDVLLENFQGYQLLYTAYASGSFTVRFFVLDTGLELASGSYPAAITGGQLNVAVRHRG